MHKDQCFGVELKSYRLAQDRLVWRQHVLAGTLVLSSKCNNNTYKAHEAAWSRFRAMVRACWLWCGGGGVCGGGGGAA